MMNKFVKFGLLILLFGFLLVHNSNAQTPVCKLQFDIFDLKSEQPKKPLEKTKVVLTDLATKKASNLPSSAQIIRLSI